MGLSSRDAEAALVGAEIVPALQAGVSEAKALLSRLLDAGVPAVLGRDDHCTSGCAPKLFVMVRAEDVPRVAQVVVDRQRQFMVEAGVDPASIALGIEASDGENPPCPACGCTGDLAADGSCPECGLQLG